MVQAGVTRGRTHLPFLDRSRLATVALALTLYILVFWLTFPSFGENIDSASTLWVVAAAWVYGVRGGLIAGLFNFLLHIALFAGIGETARMHTWEDPGMYVRLIVGATVGWMADMFRLTRSQSLALREENAKREASQQELSALSAELESRVEQRTAQLEAANKELEAFSYSVSHDLRAPLRAISGFSQILLEDYASQLDAEAQGYLNSIRGNAQQMGQLIDDLLAFSRLSRQSLSTRRIAINHLTDEVLEDLKVDIDARHIDIQVAELPSCYGDRSLIKQVLANLLSNALKFTRKREVARIEVGGEQQDNEVVYFVRDNGAGFDMRFVSKIFGVFQRLHLAEDYEGTGVGLAIVQRVVLRHGGRVWAEGEVGRGATFYFSLPNPTGGEHD